MKPIASFTVNHLTLTPGIYVSRVDGDVVTYDLRTRTPNGSSYMDNRTMHSVEHMFATCIRNSEMADRVIYFGPMGCRTGCYVLFEGDLTSEDVAPLITRMFEFIRDFEGDIPGAAARDCGNYLDQNLGMARWLAARYLNNTLYDITKEHMTYPE